MEMHPSWLVTNEITLSRMLIALQVSYSSNQTMESAMWFYKLVKGC